MALTVTRSGDWSHIAGNRRISTVTVAFDSSYPNGGESFVPADVGMRVFDRVDIEPRFGFNFDFDYTNNKILVYHGQSTGVIGVNLTAVGNVTTGEDDLISYTLQTPALDTTGKILRISAWGITANNANTKTVKLYLGATAILTQALTTSIAGSWSITALVARTGTDTQDCIATLNQGATDIAHAEFTATTIDDGADITIKCTGESNSATDDIIQEGLMVEMLVTPGTGAVGTEVNDTQSLAGLTGVRVKAYGY